MPSKTLYSQIDHIDRSIILPSPECQGQLSYAVCEEWRALHKDRPLKIIVCGQAGYGKSTLINNFLGLSISKGAKMGKSGKPITIEVTPYEKEVKGIKVVTFDTPGFCGFSDEKILQDIAEVTGGEVDLLYYCVSLRVSRLWDADIQVLRLLSMAFGKELWEHTIFILTFANEWQRQDIYEIGKVLKEKLITELLRIGVSGTVAQSITVVFAGHKDALLDYDGKELMNWKENLFVESLKMTNPKGIPALLRVHMSDEEWAMIESVKERAGGILRWLWPWRERPPEEVNDIIALKHKIWKKQTQT